MERQKFQLKIVSPCSESLDNMSAHPQGFYCHSCEKKVVDFTEKLPSEIAQFFTAHRHERICGRFQKHQLETDYAFLDPNRKMPTMKYAAGFLVSMLLSEQIAAENLVLKPLTEQSNDPILNPVEQHLSPNSLNIKGQVIDEVTGKGVFAKISVSKAQNICYIGATDANGFFDFNIKEQEQVKAYIIVYSTTQKFQQSVVSLGQFIANPLHQIKVKVVTPEPPPPAQESSWSGGGEITGDVMLFSPPPPAPPAPKRPKN